MVGVHTIRIEPVYYLNLNQTNLVGFKNFIPNPNQLYGKTEPIQTKQQQIGSDWVVNILSMSQQFYI